MGGCCRVGPLLGDVDMRCRRLGALYENRLISRLPLKLQTDLALSVHYNTLSKVQLFIDCDRALLRDLVLKLRPVIFLPGDFICKKGEVGKEMYIVSKGILEVVGGAHNETVFAQLKEGSTFGEISLLAIGGNNRRTANIRSKGYSNLFVLSKDDLNDVIKDYPEAQQILKRKARKMLRNDEKAKREEQKLADMESLTRTCAINAELETPKMLETVAKVLNPESDVSRKLNSALGHSNRRSSHDSNVWSSDSDSEIEELIRTVMGPRVGAQIHSAAQQDVGQDTQSDHE
uniref:Cyclic nucleotide-binding domain-containing protein n=1 Tax=Plectus sambesii TaxID=2011161 RepID=A0A914W327_9BILA